LKGTLSVIRVGKLLIAHHFSTNQDSVGSYLVEVKGKTFNDQKKTIHHYHISDFQYHKSPIFCCVFSFLWLITSQEDGGLRGPRGIETFQANISSKVLNPLESFFRPKYWQVGKRQTNLI
jgi:hypothetical protein